MTTPQHPAQQSPIRDALDEVIDETTDDATEDMLVEVVSAIWYGFDSPAEIDAMIDRDAEAGAGFDIRRVKAIASETLARKRATEAQWPQITDCDKLDRVFARMHEQGILALQCAGNTLSQGVQCVSEALDFEGVADDQYHGYCFFHRQDTDHALAGEGLLLAYGPIDSDEDEDEIAVGHTICEALRHEGFDVDWNGTGEARIALPRFNWQRRTPG